MPKVKIGPRHQITIPKEIFEKLELEVGEFVEVKQEDGRIVLIPQKMIPKDQAWFWSKEWQQKEREADKAIRDGQLEGPFGNAEEAIKALKGKAK